MTKEKEEPLLLQVGAWDSKLWWSQLRGFNLTLETFPVCFMVIMTQHTTISDARSVPGSRPCENALNILESNSVAPNIYANLYFETTSWIKRITLETSSLIFKVELPTYLNEKSLSRFSFKVCFFHHEKKRNVTLRISHTWTFFYQLMKNIVKKNWKNILILIDTIRSTRKVHRK